MMIEEYRFEICRGDARIRDEWSVMCPGQMVFVALVAARSGSSACGVGAWAAASTKTLSAFLDD